ncbi:MAG: DNA-binding protein [Candidatus Aenigmatarchaeota archaeon]
MKALLDTNFLMIPGEFKVDIFSHLINLGYIEFYTLDLVVKELEKLSTKGGKTSRAARLALEMIKQCGVNVLKSKGKGNVDEIMLKLAKERGFVICTQDKELISKIKAEGMRYITLRQNKYLVESGGLI